MGVFATLYLSRASKSWSPLAHSVTVSVILPEPCNTVRLPKQQNTCTHTVYLSTYLSVYVSIYLSICLSTYRAIYLGLQKEKTWGSRYDLVSHRWVYVCRHVGMCECIVSGHGVSVYEYKYTDICIDTYISMYISIAMTLHKSQYDLVSYVWVYICGRVCVRACMYVIYSHLRWRPIYIHVRIRMYEYMYI